MVPNLRFFRHIPSRIELTLTGAERPRDEPPGQRLDSILNSFCRSWPGRLHRVVRHRRGDVSASSWGRRVELIICWWSYSHVVGSKEGSVGLPARRPHTGRRRELAVLAPRTVRQ